MSPPQNCKNEAHQNRTEQELVEQKTTTTQESIVLGLDCCANQVS